jgi:hypothetical protein
MGNSKNEGTYKINHKQNMEKNKSQLGANAIWDGPVDLSMFPTQKGSSSGIKGVKLLAKNAPGYISGPITEKAKGY